MFISSIFFSSKRVKYIKNPKDSLGIHKLETVNITDLMKYDQEFTPEQGFKLLRLIPDGMKYCGFHNTVSDLSL